MPRKRKSGGEEELNAAVATASVNQNGSEVYEKGGRVLRVRDTCMCPVCGVYFSPAEIQAHASACLYFLEQVDVKKKPKKGLSSSTNANASVPTTPPKTPLSKSDSNLSPPNTTPTKRPKPVTAQWKPNTVAQWNIPYAPVFRPTVAEFKRPLEYISKIRPVAEKYGICVIVPPYPCESWNTQIGDPKTFSFRTKVQHIHQLKTRWQGRNEVFVSNLASFLEKRGEPLRTIPRIDGRDLDLFKLFSSVVNRGGYQVVERATLWKSVADDLKLSIACVRNNSLRNYYHKYLHAYEMYRKSKLHFKPASANSTQTTGNNPEDDDLYIAEDITDDLYNTDYLEDDDYDDEFGFYEGEEYTLSNFEKKARDFSDKWFPNKPTPEQVEEEFWRIVETSEDSVKVDYGSDLDVTKINRSGFPRDRADGVYVTENGTHWNLNRLPRMRGSVLSHIKETVAGVTDPMLYVGMLFSSFCWHTEDNYLYSINYMHKGTAKTWYGVPASAAEHFEEVMKEAVPDLFLKHPDLLHLLITMISPNVLSENKVPIVRAVQEPGQYVITFPKAYHAGFSHGFTCAEAVNFAPADWLPYGYESVLHYRTIKRPSVFSHEELMFTIANRDPSPETAYWLCGELQKLREREQSARDILRLAGYYVTVVPPPEPRQEPKQCKVCNYDCFLSSVTCVCSPQYVACLAHHADLCESCSSERSRTLQVHIPLHDLDVLIEKTRKLQIKTKPVIDLTDDEEAAAGASAPNMSNMNNITPAAPPQPPMIPAAPPIINKPSRSPVPAAQQSVATVPQSIKPISQTLSSPSSSSSTTTSQSITQTQQPSAQELAATEQTVPIIPQSSSPSSTSPHDAPATPSTPSPRSPPEPRKGIIINLTNNAKKKAPTNLASASTNPSNSIYQNKIPPPPTIRSANSSSLNVSSFTSFAAKQGHSDYPSSSSSSYQSNKAYYNNFYEDNAPAQAPSSPSEVPAHVKKAKPVHIVLSDSPPKA